MTEIEELAKQAIDCGLRVHKVLGPGLLESVYETVLAIARSNRGLRVERQKPIPIVFEGIAIPDAFGTDVAVEETGHRDQIA